jgi:hypothetical protein
MEDWKPDQTLQIPGASRQHTVYYWVIPAEVNGVWHVQVPAGAGKRSYELRIEQDFQVVHGSLGMEGGEIPISDASLVGDRLRFTANTVEQGRMSFDGRVDTNLMHGRVVIDKGPLAGQSDWTAQREAAGGGSTPPR